MNLKYLSQYSTHFSHIVQPKKNIYTSLYGPTLDGEGGQGDLGWNNKSRDIQHLVVILYVELRRIEVQHQKTGSCTVSFFRVRSKKKKTCTLILSET